MRVSTILLLVLAVALALIAAALVRYSSVLRATPVQMQYQQTQMPQQDAGTATLPGSPGIANPASVNCVQTLGGQLEIRDEAAGQIGYCHLPDGRVCEEWALYRDNTCTPPR